MTSKTLYLSKSRYQEGNRCAKLLWLKQTRPELAASLSDADKTRMEEGIDAGKLARSLYPKGILINEVGMDKAIEATRQALSQAATVIFEATFFAHNTQIKADILIKVEDGIYDLIEVKASTKKDEKHLHDLAVQLWIIRESGLKIRRACLLLLNSNYLYEGGTYNLQELFKLEDYTTYVEGLVNVTADNAKRLYYTLISDKMPDVKTSNHCKRDGKCQYFEYCHQDEPEYPIRELNNIRDKSLEELKNQGIYDIRDIPPNSKIGLRYSKVITSLREMKPIIAPDIAQELDNLIFPLYFLDFEAVQYALPFFPNSHPYQQVPFQWSCHVLEDQEHEPIHFEYLHESPDDPRRAFGLSLISLVKSKGSIIVYNATFEKSRIKELKNILPDFQQELDNILARIFDLWEVVKEHCYHPSFRGSYSIKDVLPALVPGQGYKDLEIQGGDAAQQTYKELLAGDCTPKRAQDIKEALLAYCKQDTRAMFDLYKVLYQATKV